MQMSERRLLKDTSLQFRRQIQVYWFSFRILEGTEFLGREIIEFLSFDLRSPRKKWNSAEVLFILI